MPITKDQREVVRLLSLEHGHKKASELTGVPYDVVRQWSVRGNWKASHSVTKTIVDNVQNEIAENERATRVSLSRYSKRAAQEAETAKLKDSHYVKQAAQVAGIAFKWDAKEQQSGNVVVNIALLGVDPDTVTAEHSTTIDVET